MTLDLDATPSVTSSPRCVVVAGPNGAGKSTVAPELVRALYGIGRYVDADAIAAGLAGFSPAIADRRAGRIALETIGRYMAGRVEFAFETTLSGRRWPRLLDALEEAGYVTLLHYLWLPAADLAVERVRFRAARGGHEIPEGDVRRRYTSSLRNLRAMWLPRVHAWHVLDASRLPDLVRIAAGGRDIGPKIHDPDAWASISGAGRVREQPPARDDHMIPSPDEVAAAASRGVRRALAIHRALGVPTAVWRDGRVVIVPAAELPEFRAEDAGLGEAS